MIYLALDTQVYRYLIQEVYKRTNTLEKIFYYLEKDKVKFLIPQIIADELVKHLDLERRETQKKLLESFRMAKTLLEVEGIDITNKGFINEIVDLYLDRMNNYFKTKSKVIPNTDNNKEVVSRGLKGIPPFSKKGNEVADTVFLLSIKKYCQENPIDRVFFVSNDKTAFGTLEKSPENNTSYQLSTEFNDLEHFTAIIGNEGTPDKILEKMANFLQKMLGKVPENIEHIISHVIRPEWNNQRPDGFIDLISEVELIKKKVNPSSSNVRRLLEILKLAPNLESYFFENLDNVVWFNILLKNDYFTCKNIPHPLEKGDGFNIPYWVEATYLVNISEHFKKNEYLHLVPKVLDIIKKCSKANIDNYRVCHQFIVIISNIPRSEIDIETIESLGSWFDSEFKVILQSNDLVELLLPKFLEDEPGKNDIDKANAILKMILSIEQIKDESGKVNYASKVEQHLLTNKLLKQELLEKISTFCVKKVVEILEININEILFVKTDNYSAQLTIEKQRYRLSVTIKKGNLLCSFSCEDVQFGDFKIDGFAYYPYHQLKETIFKEISNYIKITGFDNEGELNEFIFKILNGNHYIIPNGNILHELDGQDLMDDDLLNSFVIILRDVLKAGVRTNLAFVKERVLDYAKISLYRGSIFKELAIYLIAEDFDSLSTIFWKLVANQPPMNFNPFHYSKVDDELYRLFKINSNKFSKNQLKQVSKLIHMGPLYDPDTERWKAMWFSALSAYNDFNVEYKNIANKIGISENYFDREKVPIFRSGVVSPISAQELREKTIEDLVIYLKAFKPSDDFDGPNKEGLSRTLSEIVEESPDRFMNQYFILNVDLEFKYWALSAFRNTVQNKSYSNFNKLLGLLKFLVESLSKENDGVEKYYTKGRVVSEICEIITLTFNSIQHDEKLINVAYTIIKASLKVVISYKSDKREDFDFLTHSINTDYGKVLNSLYGYSNCIYKKENKRQLWSEKVKPLIEFSIADKRSEPKSLLGRYFNLVSYFDEEFATDFLKDIITPTEKGWEPFISGLRYGTMCNKRGIFEALFPHFRKMVMEQGLLTDDYVKHFNGHWAIYLFWGFDRKDSGINNLFIQKAKVNDLKQYINYIGNQRTYYDSLEIDKQKDFQETLKWCYSNVKSRFDEDTDKNEVYTALLSLLCYFDSLDNEIFTLIHESVEHIRMLHDTHELFENLERISSYKETEPSLSNVANILVLLNMENFHPFGEDENRIHSIVRVLYENNHVELANSFCNKVATRGFRFLNSLYSEFNNLS